MNEWRVDFILDNHDQSTNILGIEGCVIVRASGLFAALEIAQKHLKSLGYRHTTVLSVNISNKEVKE